jgi:hypothetical protein
MPREGDGVSISVVVTGHGPLMTSHFLCGDNDADGRVMGERNRRRSSNGYARP